MRQQGTPATPIDLFSFHLNSAGSILLLYFMRIPVETMSSFKKLFTPAEAEKTLPLVRKIVTDILNEGYRLREAITVSAYEDPKDDPEVNGHLAIISDYLAELDEIGCFFKDWDFSMGLVDFPSVIDGEEVFLCWRSDEPEIAYYHRIEEGFAGRALIPREYIRE